MLKAAVTSPRADFYGVEFETVVYGRKSYAHPSTFIPCASYEHARAVAKAYNGVAFTEERHDPPRTAGYDLADGKRGTDGELNHHGDQPRYGMSRGAPMGVADFTAPDVTPQDTLHFGIRRVALDEGGYAPDGVYWGLPRNNLWHASTGDSSNATLVSRWFRAPSYAHAVAVIREQFPNATTQRVP